MLYVRDRLASHASFVRDGFFSLEQSQPAGLACSAPCQGAELAFDDPAVRRDVVDAHYRNRAASSDVVHVAQRRERSDLLLPSFLSDLCRRIDAELGAGPERRARNHDEACEMWQTFQEVAGSRDFRTTVRRHQASVASPARARCFEAILEKTGGKSYGFVIHKAPAHRGVLFVDEVQLGGVLDLWNKDMHESGRTMYCIQPLAVIINVNGASGDHGLMARELLRPEAVLHVVNPPTVSDIVCVYDVLREGGVHPAPFWEGNSESDSDTRAGIADAQWDDPASRAAPQQPPEFSHAGSGERGVMCLSGKDRGCVGVQNMEECLEPASASHDEAFRYRGHGQDAASDPSAPPGGARRNMF